MKPTINILNFNISNNSINEILDKIYTSVNKKDKLTITYLNSYILTFLKKDTKFHSLINKFNITHSDGIGIYWASKLLYKEQGLKSKTTGTDLYFNLLNNKNPLKYFVLGGVRNCSELIQNNSSGYGGNIRVIGAIYKPGNSEEDLQIINTSRSDILLVGLGTPYQEEWIIQNKDKVNVPVIIAVGSGLDFLAGVKKRAPLWMQKTGFEWLYRLFQEPKRLWKRYIIGIPVFMFNIILIKVKLMLKKEST